MLHVAYLKKLVGTSKSYGGKLKELQLLGIDLELILYTKSERTFGAFKRGILQTSIFYLQLDRDSMSD